MPPPPTSSGRKAPLHEVEWEVLPPETKGGPAELAPLFKWMALIMDEFLRIPGTKFRFGLDPIIGLIPGLGDTGSALLSAFALIQAARRGLPKIILARMSLNILINELIGAIPIVGDAFSFWFKSNVRNYELIRTQIATPRASQRSDWFFVIGVLVVLGMIVCGGMLISFLMIREIIRFLF